MNSDTLSSSLEGLGEITEENFDSIRRYPIPTDTPGEFTEIIAGTCHIDGKTIEAKITRNSQGQTEHVYIVINNTLSRVTDVVTGQVGAGEENLFLSIVPDSGDISLAGKDPSSALARPLNGVDHHELDVSGKKAIVGFLSELRKKAA